jgi:hypothetical protein
MPLPCGISLPHAKARVLALMQHYCDRSPPHHRPHVSLSEALPPAFASCGIPHDTPCGWHLLTTMRERTCRVTPFPISIPRIRRTVFSTGFLWRCKPVSGCDCRRLLLCPFGSSVSASYARSHERWLITPLLALSIDACETGYPERGCQAPPFIPASDP